MKRTVSEELKDAWSLAQEYGRAPVAPPRGTREGFVYGLVQPFLGLRVLLQNPDLLRASLVPAAWVALMCIGWTVHETETWKEAIPNFYVTVIALAPVPALLFAKRYAILAATVHERLGFGPCTPKILSFRRALREFIAQSVLVWLVSAPFLLIANFFPGPLETVLSVLVTAGWGLHWTVVTSLGEARVLEPGQTLAEADAEDREAVEPWFVRAFTAVGDAIPFLGGMIRAFAGRLSHISVPMREELAVVETHRALSAGFAVSSFALLAIPGLNLFLRPMTLVAASHVLGQLEHSAPRTAGIIDALPVVRPSSLEREG